MSSFELKKILGNLLMPLPLLFALVLIGLFLLVLKQRKSGLVFFVPSMLTLLLISLPIVTQALINSTENKYKPFNAEHHTKLNYILVLGCQIKPNKYRPANAQLGACSLARLVEGLRIARKYPYAKLIVSGYGYGGATSSALMKKTALSLGLHNTRVLTNPKAKDTSQEAKLLAYKLVDAKVALVTSAAHMSRSIDLFNQQGIDVIPAPTDFYALNQQPLWLQFIPSPEAFLAVTAHQHELIGSLWIKLLRLYDPESI
ncbi:hypothetical protein CJF42_04030 [Pseudoalteromonas sp. NBT06-2]|uniref:ElyC/SanA/YdcF family protein n=1 Tax=Pseudoalteromonas sp. NBT06-2 TaxID=2025950 RepID=UPI000BA4F457|nr:ElyC/SanA/YdcF family protein [Pseudoalteromonas sp. NBT06-2]PAJ75667.1 hypothetical protein CJF42_04030 [Pseudoalteromonas sp. NBT06-2]